MSDIFDKLKSDHKKQREMLETIKSSALSDDKKTKLYSEIKNELEEHAKYEERVFYKPLISDDKTQDQARHSISEHKDIDDCIEKIDSLDINDSTWSYHIAKLSDLVEHHLKEEEEDIFPLAQKVFTENQKEKLGDIFTEKRSN